MDQQTGEETTDDGMPLKQECNVIDARELVGTFASMLNALISFEPMAICVSQEVRLGSAYPTASSGRRRATLVCRVRIYLTIS